MFLTFGDVMMDGLFITPKGLFLSVEAAGILIDADIVSMHLAQKYTYNLDKCTTYTKQNNYAFFIKKIE
jgi:hypothetical protein